MWVDPRLGLVSHHDVGCVLGNDEDAQLLVDRERSALPSRLGGDFDGSDATPSFVRALSRAEAELLTNAGADPRDVARSVTQVFYLTPSVRARRFSLIRASALPSMPSVDVALVR